MPKRKVRDIYHHIKNLDPNNFDDAKKIIGQTNFFARKAARGWQSQSLYFKEVKQLRKSAEYTTRIMSFFTLTLADTVEENIAYRGMSLEAFTLATMRQLTSLLVINILHHKNHINTTDIYYFDEFVQDFIKMGILGHYRRGIEQLFLLPYSMISACFIAAYFVAMTHLNEAQQQAMKASFQKDLLESLMSTIMTHVVQDAFEFHSQTKPPIILSNTFTAPLIRIILEEYMPSNDRDLTPLINEFSHVLSELSKPTYVHQPQRQAYPHTRNVVSAV